MFAIGAAWALLGYTFSYVTTMHDEQLVMKTNVDRILPDLEKQIKHIEKLYEHCVKNDLYQLDKMYTQEKLNFCKNCK